MRELKIPEIISQTGNLHNQLTLKVGARVFLSLNINVADGLTNGAYGNVVYIHTSKDPNDRKEKVSHVLVQFDSPRVGVEAK